MLKTSTFASNADDSARPKDSKRPFKYGQHAIWSCKKFKSTRPNERREHVQKFRLCFNCLRPGQRQRIAKVEPAVCLIVEDNTTNFAQCFLKRGGDNRHLRCYDSRINKHHARRTLRSVHKTGEWEPQPERSFNV